MQEIVRAIDGERFLGWCVLGFPGCGDVAPCPVHSQWVRARDVIIRMINTKSVHRLSKEIEGKLDIIHKDRKA